MQSNFEKLATLLEEGGKGGKDGPSAIASYYLSVHPTSVRLHYYKWYEECDATSPLQQVTGLGKVP